MVQMIRIVRLSGAELATVAVGEVPTVASLKHYLHQQYGLPESMQKLMNGDGVLSNGTELDVPGDLQLVLVLRSS